MDNKLVYFKTKYVNSLKILFEVIKNILPDTTIKFIKEQTVNDEDNHQIKKENIQIEKKCIGDSIPWSGIRIVDVNPGKSILIILNLDGSQLQDFKCFANLLEFGINLACMNRIFKNIDKEDELVMYIDKNNDKLLKINTSNNSRRIGEFELELEDLPNTQIKIPKMKYDVCVTMCTKEFHKLCKNMDQLTDFVEIRCTEKIITFSCKNDRIKQVISFAMNDNVKITWPEEDKNNNLIIQNTYGLRELNIFNKCNYLCKEIQLFMKNDYPLGIRYIIAPIGIFSAYIVPIKRTDVDD